MKLLFCVCYAFLVLPTAFPFISKIFSIKKTNSDISATRKPTVIIKPALDGSPAKRYIHPQVYKMFQRAQTLSHEGQNTVALKLLRRCIELNPMDSHSWLALARLESKLGNTDKARSSFEESLTHCPRNIHILHAWGHMEQKQGNSSYAKMIWSEALSLEPLNPYVCHALSNLEIKLQNFDQAKLILENVIDVKPTSELFILLSDIERQQGNSERSKQILSSGLQKCRRDRYKLLLALAWLEEDSFKDTAAAERHLNEALSIESSNVRAYMAKASMYLRRNNIADARTTLQMTANLTADDGKHYTMWSTLESDCGNFKEARRILERGAMIFSGDPFLLQRWGTLESQLGNFAKARELFMRSVDIKPHAPTYVAWAILEEEETMKALGRAPLSDEDISNETFFGLQTGSGLPGRIVLDEEVLQVTEKVVQGISLDDDESSCVDLDKFVVEDSTKSKSDFHLVRSLFSLGMKADAYHGPLYHAYGNMELRHGNVSGARKIFLAGIAMNCSDVTSQYHALGLLELKAGNEEKCRSIFKRGIELSLRGMKEIDSGAGFLLHSLGMLELNANRLTEALDVFTTGVSLFENHSQMLLGLALTNMKRGHYDEAREAFQTAVKCDASHAHAWQSWAVAEKSLSNFDEARNLFSRGLAVCPNHGALWQAYGVMEMQLGRLDVARELFKEGVKRCPSHAPSHQAWALLEIRHGDFAKAKALVALGIRISPNHPALWTLAGIVEEKMGNPLKAQDILNVAINRFPKHGVLYKVMGEMLVRIGDYAQARSYFARGINASPLYAELYHSSAMLEAKLGDLEALSVLHKKARASFPSALIAADIKSPEDILEKIKLLRK